ncbi:MAG: hypothetical protein Q8M31_17085 [Beijerinckiaceae bacterium]|nr:hypothetical protein [Beijerinckiaceae bacterium]
MKKYLLGTAAALSLSAATALAADLPVRMPASAPASVYAAPVFTWSGFYVGVNAGWARGGRGFNHGFANDFGTFQRLNPMDPALVATGAGTAFPYIPGEIDTAPVFAVANPALRGVAFDDALFGDERSRAKNGFTGGVQLGYNWQFGAFVLGVEGDVNWIGGRRGGARGFNTGDFAFQGEFTGNGGPLAFDEADVLLGTLTPAGQDFTFVRTGEVVAPGEAGTFYNGDVRTTRRQSKWLSTARVRAGFAFDRFMVYGTGGLAFQSAGRSTSTTNLTRTDCRPDAVFENALGGPTIIQGGCAATANTYSASRRSDSVGWAAGLGFEWAVFNNMSLGFEWVHADFGKSRTDFIDPVLTAAGDTRGTRTPVNRAGVVLAANDVGAAPAGVIRSVSHRDSHDLFRVKLNYRFGGPAVSSTASY